MFELLLQRYEMAFLALGVLGGLMLVQLLVADFYGIKVKHQPGAAVKADHSNFLFRATRTVANTNESIGIFLVLFLVAIFTQADATWTQYSVWTYVLARICYAGCYYADIRLVRSVCFGVSLLGMVTLLGVTVLT